MKIAEMVQELEIPEGVEVNVENNGVAVKGEKGELQRNFVSKKITFSKSDNKVILSAKNATKREKTMMNTFKAHVKNMFKGVIEGHKYELKICSGHFPMNVALKGDELSIKNFLGEKVPRVMKIQPDVKVKIDGEKIVVEGIDIEKCGQCAANIEKTTRITNRDRRIFQDGIWITSKPGKVW